MLRYVLSDLDKNEVASNLEGLPPCLLPMAICIALVPLQAKAGTRSIVSGPPCRGTPLGSQHPLLVHPLATPFLREWVQHDDVARLLDIVPMTIAVLAERLGDVLPSHWHEQRAVVWNEQPGEPTRAWMSCFWRFLGLQECNDLSPFANWPVIPVTDQGTPMLLGAKHKNCVLSLRYTVEKGSTMLSTPIPFQLS